jgi:hypothetical protein
VRTAGPIPEGAELGQWQPQRGGKGDFGCCGRRWLIFSGFFQRERGGRVWNRRFQAGNSRFPAAERADSFPSGVKMWVGVRVRAIGADNATGPWSGPAVKTVP